MSVDINKAPKAHWSPGPTVTSMEQAATFGEQVPLPQTREDVHLSLPEMNDSKYLRVPVDECRQLSSPPCSPVPPNWSELLESPPVPWIEDFDLEAESGLVHLGNGQWVDLSMRAANNASTADDRDGRRMFVVRRRGAVLSRKTAALRLESVKRLCFGEDGDPPTMAPADDTILPPIIVDAYE